MKLFGKNFSGGIIFGLFITSALASYIPYAVTSGGNHERLERIAFGGATEGTNVCTVSPCTIYRQSGAISSVTRNSTGNYTVNFTAGTFTAPPSCTVATGRIVSDSYSSLITPIPTTTAVSMASVSNGTLTPTDGSFNVICVGPR